MAIQPKIKVLSAKKHAVDSHAVYEHAVYEIDCFVPRNDGLSQFLFNRIFNRFRHKLVDITAKSRHFAHQAR